MIVANTVLFIYPVVVAVLFAKFGLARAVAITLIFGYLFLPERVYFNLPVIPTLEKHSIPALSAFLLVLFASKKPGDFVLPGWFPQGLLPRILIIILIASAFMTVMTNGDPLQFGPLYLPGLRPYDALSSILAILVGLLPFLLGRRCLAHPEQQKMLLTILVVGGFVYSFLALFEVRMSPQLNNMVYGFFPHAFIQHIRGDGFRPLVFLSHGLVLSIFFSATVLAAASLSRVVEADKRRRYLALTLWLLLTLFLSKSLGALAITLVLLPVALFTGVRQQLMVCAVLSVIVLTYPALRSAGWVPVETLLAWAESIDPERARSLSFRLLNEDILLAKAFERPLFGWGAFGRNMLYDERGIGSVVTDGYWVIIVGQGGWIRYLAEFGLLCMPAIIAFLKLRKAQFGIETAGLMLILTANLVDLLPNASVTPLTWFVTGAIWGRIELGRVTQTNEQLVSNDPSTAQTKVLAIKKRRARV